LSLHADGTPVSTDRHYPTAADVRAIHADIVAESDATDAGVRAPDAVDSALAYVSVGYFGAVPETIHGATAHLVRLLVADHPFVDGNKRTALNAAAVCYDLNGYTFAYDDEPIRTTLKRFGTDADGVDVDAVADQFRAFAVSADGDDGERGRLRETARTAADPDRHEAVCRLAALDREHNRDTYERLARE
jgi:death-on-curing protein